MDDTKAVGAGYHITLRGTGFCRCLNERPGFSAIGRFINAISQIKRPASRGRIASEFPGRVIPLIGFTGSGVLYYTGNSWVLLQTALSGPGLPLISTFPYPPGNSTGHYYVFIGSINNYCAGSASNIIWPHIDKVLAILGFGLFAKRKRTHTAGARIYSLAEFGFSIFQLSFINIFRQPPCPGVYELAHFKLKAFNGVFTFVFLQPIHQFGGNGSHAQRPDRVAVFLFNRPICKHRNGQQKQSCTANQ